MDGHVATVWLDSPQRRNAMGPAFWDDLPPLMRELSDDREVRAVVIAAQGPHFTVGLDLKAFGTNFGGGGDGARSEAARRTELLRTVKRMQGTMTAVADCPKPVLAAVHGYCIGGGIDLITACDVRLASADAIFSVRETKIAIVADVGTLQRLPGIVGEGHVAELVYTGKDVGAARAKEIGLVNDVLPDADGVARGGARDGDRDRRQLAAGGAGFEGRPPCVRADVGRRRPRLRCGLEQRLRPVERRRGGHGRVHREAAAALHRRLSRRRPPGRRLAIRYSTSLTGSPSMLADQVVVSLACTVDGNV